MVTKYFWCVFLISPGRVLDGAALLMRAVAEGGAAAAGPLREAALSEGAMLHHLLTACTAQVARHSRSLIWNVIVCELL